jgi:hypothetical protein
MKTLNNIIAFAALIIIADICNAKGNIIPDTNSTLHEKNNIFSFSQINNDNEKIKSAENTSPASHTKAANDVYPVAIQNDFSYLKFDVNTYIDEHESEISDLPVSEFDYLRFDVNYYMEQNQVNTEEVPDNEFEYLRFDVTKYMLNDNIHNNNGIGELPLAE